MMMTVLAAVCAGSVYLIRQRITSDEFVMAAGLGLFFLHIALGILGTGVALALIAVFMRHARRSPGSILPIIVFIGGTTLAMIGPLPAQTPVNPLESHRADYEAIVELARQHGLEVHPSCLNGWTLPDQYLYVAEGCVLVIEDPALALAFDPLDTQRWLIYAETEAALDRLIDCCMPKGSLAEQYDQVWYLFTPAQD
jgi:hypothetical protein